MNQDGRTTIVEELEAAMKTPLTDLDDSVLVRLRRRFVENRENGLDAAAFQSSI